MDGRTPPLPLLLGDGWYEDRYGGLNRYLANLFIAYRELGGKPLAVVVGPGTGAPAGFTLAGHQNLPLPLRIWKFARAAELSCKGAQLVDAHFALYAFLPVVFGKLRHLPLVVHFQGPWAEESRSALKDSNWRAWIKRRIETLVYSKADRIVTLSGDFRRILVERYGQTPWKIDVVPPGVDVGRFRPGDQLDARLSLGLQPNARVVVAVRRLVPRMGLDVLIQAWFQVKESVPNAILMIVGDGPERAPLEDLAREVELGSSIRFLGRVDDATLVACYRASNAAVVPTTTLEGYGLIVLEALACGVPVVATNVGGLPEALNPLDPSLIIPPDDPVALAARLSALLESKSPTPTRRQCREYAETFSWERIASRNAAIYARAVKVEPRKLRVVFLDHSAQLSGGEIALLRLLQEFHQIEAHVVLAEDGPLASKLVGAGISVEVLRMNERSRGLSKDQLIPSALPLGSAIHTAIYCLTLTRRLRRLKPDLVHTNSLKAGLYGTVCSRLARIPSVWHLRDRIAVDYLPRFAVKLVRAWARFMPTGLIANSAATLATVGPKSRTSIIPSPIAPRPLSSEKELSYHNPPGGPLLIGMVGRICPWKGQHVFLKAFADAFPNDNCRAVLIGAPLFGEEDYDRELRTLAKELMIEDRVDMKGFRDDVNGELAQLDVLVHASTSPEPFGLVVVEGMAAGLPVVASDGGGPAEVITHNVNGLLYPPGDVQSLSTLLLKLSKDVELRRRLGDSARLRSLEFAPEAIGIRVMTFYREVLAHRWPPEVARP